MFRDQIQHAPFQMCAVLHIKLFFLHFCGPVGVFIILSDILPPTALSDELEYPFSDTTCQVPVCSFDLVLNCVLEYLESDITRVTLVILC